MHSPTIPRPRTSDPLLPGTDPDADRERFAALYAHHRDELGRYCRSILRHDQDVEDALQSTMAKAFAALQSETREITLRPWLFRIAHNEAISIVRRRVDAAELDDRDGAAMLPEPVPPAIDAGRADDGSGLRLDAVSVARGGRPVLHDVGLAIAPGERVALVGPSGSGKSTVGELLVGFLPAADVTGSAALGGTPLSALDGPALRDRVLHVPQDPYVFDADLAANLRLARPDASDEQLGAALRAVGAGPWFDGLSAGLATRVGERGRALSGGERQRLGLARIRLRCVDDRPAGDVAGRPDGVTDVDDRVAGIDDGVAGVDDRAGDGPPGTPRFLVLDEPVSHLPPAEGHAVLAALLDAAPDVGALLIAHRPDEAALADRTVRLGADGRLRERGDVAANPGGESVGCGP